MSAAAQEVPDVTRNTPYDDLPQWMSVQEVAVYTGMSSWAVYQGVHRGDIPHRRMGMKLILIPKEFFHPRNAAKQVTP